MRINDVTRHKGTDVVTITPDASVGDLLDLLFRNGIGAVVVSQDGRSVEGIVSERDVVRHLQARGAAVLDAAVADIMTSEVSTCAPTSSRTVCCTASSASVTWSSTGSTSCSSSATSSSVTSTADLPRVAWPP